MNELVKKRWVEALRSGIYDQEKFNLKTKNGYCCLGVLCDILGHDFTSIERGGLNGVLPDYIRKKAGLKSRNPELIVDYWDLDKDTQSVIPEDEFYPKADLSEVNDELRFSFDDIADLIEEQL